MSSIVLSGDTSGAVTVSVPAVAGTNTVTIPATTGNIPVLPTGYTLGGGDTSRFKNRIINGDMRIDQRNSGASVTPTDGQYTVDRWAAFRSQASKYTVQQNAGSVTPPVGFTNYLGATSSSAYSITSTDYFSIAQYIEGFNVADFGWGTANAQTVTLSFWVRSSLTGTFGGAIQNSALNRSYPFSYTINSANTWEKETITIPGDTSGTWLTTNGKGVTVNLSLATGSTFSGTAGTWAATNYSSVTGATSVVGTSGATFYITGLQLEVASNATSFEYVDYTTQLAMCQRYYAKQSSVSGGSGAYAAFGSGFASATTQCYTYIKYSVAMRAAPTFNYANIQINNAGVQTAVTSIAGTYPGSDSLLVLLNASGGGLTAGYGTCVIAANSTAAYVDFAAEL
jgi:hypothetical protein